MSAAVLSICIPTYNRADDVRGVIETLDSLRTRLPVELVVSDDASSDGTPAWLEALAARDPAVRVYRQANRLGDFANAAFALRAARARFALRLGEDDRLIDDAVVDLIGWLKAHPRHAAVYAPAPDRDVTDAAVAEFDHATRLELVDHLAHEPTPDHAIYRSDCLRCVGYDASVHWSLGLLDAALQAGAVRFQAVPYCQGGARYRPTTDLISWEAVRAGLETIVARQPGLAAEPARLAAAGDRIADAIRRRQVAAFDGLAAQGRWIEFVDAYRILAARHALPRAYPATERRHASLRAIAMVLAEQGALSERGRVVLVGLDDGGEMLAEALREIGVADVVARVPTDDDAAAALLVAADAEQAESLVAVGVPAHAVFDVSGLLRGFDLGELG